MNTDSPRTRRSGFSLIELLVVIAVIGILAAILVPVVNSVKERARTVECASNMRQVSLYVLMYSTEKQLLPKLGENDKQVPWAYRLVEAGILKDYKYAVEIYKNEGVFRCPSDEMPSSGIPRPSYAMNMNLANIPSRTEFNGPLNIPNPAKTILLGEVHGNRDQQSYVVIFTNYIESNTGGIAFDRHAGSANFAFVDGHVENLSLEETYDPANGVDLWTPTH